MKARPPAPKADCGIPPKCLISVPYVSMRYGQPVEVCGALLNPEAPDSYKIIYSPSLGSRITLGRSQPVKVLKRKSEIA